MAKSIIFHGYLVLVSTFILNFVSVGVFNSAGLYLNPLKQSFPSSSDSILALYCTFQIVVGLASSFVGGVLQDVLDQRGVGVAWLFFGGGVFMALGFVWSSLSSTLLNVLVGSLLMGVGIGLGGFMAGGICVLWFEAARGMMLLLAISGQGLGNVFFAWATARLLEVCDEEEAWRPTMRWIGVLCFVLSAVSSVAMRMPEPGEVEEHERGERGESLINGNESDDDYGSIKRMSGTAPRRRSTITAFKQVREETGHGHGCHFSPGTVESSRSRRRSTTLGSFRALSNGPLLNLSDFHDEIGVGTQRHRSTIQTIRSSLFGEASLELDKLDESGYTLREVALSSTNLWLNAFTLIACFPFLNMQVLLPPYIDTLGMPPSVAGQALAMFGIGDFVSNLTLGTVADKIGARQVFALAFSILSLLFFIWPYCTTVPSLSFIAFSYGYFCCTISSMPIIILADAYGESSSEHVLALNGITNMFKFPGYLLGPSLAGMVVDKSGGTYGAAAVCSGVMTLIGTVMLLLVPTPEEQQRRLAESKKASDV